MLKEPILFVHGIVSPYVEFPKNKTLKDLFSPKVLDLDLQRNRGLLSWVTVT